MNLREVRAQHMVIRADELAFARTVMAWAGCTGAGADDADSELADAVSKAQKQVKAAGRALYKAIELYLDSCNNEIFYKGAIQNRNVENETQSRGANEND